MSDSVSERPRVPEEGFLNAILEHYGYDFNQYHQEMVGRQIGHCLQRMGLTTQEQLLEKLLSDATIFQAFLGRLSVSVSTMFRDPEIYNVVRRLVLPRLATYPRIRIWTAGIANGQEVYSLAILLWEAGLYQRSTIYATDLNATLVRQAQRGRFPLERMAEFTRNYWMSGGREEFSRYYVTTQEACHIIPALKQNIVFSTHNLAMDWVFNEFQWIVCRNVIIYFNQELTERVLQLFNGSLSEQGMLWLGSKERIRFYRHGCYFEPMGEEKSIFYKR
ncbi:MAG: protein-glutamate O-methyltransferase CheR [Magnetococcales bacterium]|nr:protein-glutamate O-methyltransferase CheR [Magnetococcales bacterium]MBF0438281.1 protein-glutamate O-methyltransferase CheR [Magnetococcales bacterium]